MTRSVVEMALVELIPRTPRVMLDRVVFVRNPRRE